MLQKSEGFRFGVANDEVVVNYCDPMAAPYLEFSGFPPFDKNMGVKKMEKNRT
jgi:hypothetical protein